MGLKLGVASIAAKSGAFIQVDPNVHPHRFAQVVSLDSEEDLGFFLAYPDGKIGILVKDGATFQLDLFMVMFEAHFCPTELQMLALTNSLPKKEILFEGAYWVRATIPEQELLPPAEHVDDETRFSNPQGLWEQVVAGHVL